MAAAGTDDGHQRLATNQCSPVQVAGAVISCTLLRLQTLPMML